MVGWAVREGVPPRRHLAEHGRPTHAKHGVPVKHGMPAVKHSVAGVVFGSSNT